MDCQYLGYWWGVYVTHGRWGTVVLFAKWCMTAYRAGMIMSMVDVDVVNVQSEQYDL